MNKLFKLIILGLLFSSCTQKLFTTQVSNLPETEDGTIHLRSSGFGNTLPQAFNDAMIRGFNMVLFKGVPESIQSTPLIPDEAKAKAANPGLMDCFTNKECYTQFTTQINQIQGKDKVRSGFTTTVDYKVNIRALRTYLEKNNIIRKFGY